MKSKFSASAKKVLNNIRSSGLLEKGDRVLVALSGGADSVFLLRVLLEIKDTLDVSVCAAHLNHGIRGDEADRDELFSRELCGSFGVEFVSEKVSIPDEMQKTGEGCEECARRVRYAFLQSAAKALECNKIATAHHADDNIETVLLHMIRGSALGGLTGIKPYLGNIIRPLLCVSREEIMESLAEIGQAFVTDSTNASDDMTRNFIRHNILPNIYALNPKADTAFFKMCRALKEDGEYLEAQAAKISEEASLKELKELPPSMLSRFLINKFSSYFKENGKPAPMLDGAALEKIMGAVYGKNGTSRFDVSGGVCAYVDSKGVTFDEVRNGEENSFFQELKMGENIISSNGYKILITKDKKVAYEWQNIYKLSIRKSLNSDKIIKDGKSRIFVRSRQAGDSYVFGGMKRDIRRQFINLKIPQRKRASLPVFCTDEGPFWVPVLPLADEMKAADESNAVYIVCAE